MAENYYLDTQTWLDFAEKRGYNGEIVKRLLQKIIKENKIILYSDFTIRELKKLGYLENEINKILSAAKPNNLKRIHKTKEQFLEGKKLAKQRNIPLGDAIHAILARDHEATLVSRDSDFQRLKDIVETKTPEDLV